MPPVPTPSGRQPPRQSRRDAPRKNLAGNTYGRWTVLAFQGFAEYGSGRKAEWRCRCECGNEANVLGSNLTTGKSTSCGCIQKERTTARSTTHGLRRTRLYSVWNNMRRRCLDPRHKDYQSYGGRGITVCERWADVAAFYEDMGHPPAGHTLERIDNDLSYSPDNCRWATMREQSQNRRTSSAITYQGQTRTASEWARITGISRTVIEYRLKAGWDTGRALTETPRGSK